MKNISNNNILAAMLLCLMAVCSLGMQAQGFTAAGKVVDGGNEPLAGATVRAQGQGGGTVTDLDGRFTLACKPGSRIEVTYVGYKTQTAAAAADMTVVMQEEASVLGEAVVVGVGYGTMRKSDLTGSIASVSAADMKKGVITSTEQLLQGKVAGLSVVQSSGNVESGASIRLRGGTSLSASNGPLVVVDGIPGVDFNTVQPGEIVSIDVLKDASAAAIYGSRGANGVIIVTTNRQAADTEAVSMQYNGYVAVSSVARQLDMLSASQWRQYVRQNNVAGALDYGASTDWQDELYRTGVSHQHNISLSKAGKNGGYRASASYQNNQGVVKRNSMNRLAGSLSAYQTGLGGRLRLDEGINAAFDSWHPVDSRIYERMLNLNPTFPVRNPDGSYAQLGGTNTENPVEINNNRTEDWKRHRFLGYVKAELDIYDGLKWAANTSYEYNNATKGIYKPGTAQMEGKSEKGWGQRTYEQYVNKQLETFLTYDKNIAGGHHLNLMAGYSYLDNVSEGFGATRSGFSTDAFLYNNLGAGTDFRQGDVYSYKSEMKLISFFGRANYSFLGRYMFTATVRHDGSSVFGKNNKWGTFPSASLAWRVSDEKFMQGARGWLDNLKLRVGYGVTGNQSGIGSYQSMSILTATGAAYYDPATGKWLNSYTQAQNVNPDLKWESTAQWNIGVDFSLFNRLTGSIELYHKKTSDLLWTYPVPQPPYIVGTMLANVGDMVNKGVELTLGAGILRHKDYTLEANLSLSYNHQEITKLSNGNYHDAGLQAGSLHNIRGYSGVYSQVIKEGYPAGAFWGPKCRGVDENGKFIVDRDENGNPVNQYLGSAQPKFNIGLSVSATYKDFDLSVAGYGMLGQKVLNATRMQLFDPTRLPAQNTLDDYLSSNVRESLYTSYFIERGDFFRLQSLTLGYTIPGTARLGFSRVRVYLTGENLFCLTGYKGVDPEVSAPDNVLDGPGIDRLITDSGTGNGATFSPRPRTFSIGLNLSF